MSISDLVIKEVESQSNPIVRNPRTFRWLFSAGFSAITKAGNFLISGYKTQVLFVLSQSKVVGLKSSNDWGVLLPENNGQILLLPGDFIQVIVPRISPSREAVLDTQLWKIKELKFLKPDSLLTQLQTDIAVVTLAKISLEKELRKLTEEIKETKIMYELIDYCQECTSKHNELYLYQLEAVDQLENLLLIQNEYIQKLLAVLNSVDFEKEGTNDGVCLGWDSFNQESDYVENLVSAGIVLSQAVEVAPLLNKYPRSPLETKVMTQFWEQLCNFNLR
jgi:hypothetical protein